MRGRLVCCPFNWMRLKWARQKRDQTETDFAEEMRTLVIRQERVLMRNGANAAKMRQRRT